MGQWYVGVLCSLVACVGTVTGIIMQKYSHMTEDQKPKDQRRAETKRPLWWMSLFFMILVPAPLDYAAFAFAAQSILAPLAGVTLLLNVVASPFFLGEKVSWSDIGGTVLIAVGAGLTTSFGSRSDKQYSIPEFLVLYQRPIFIGYFVVANIVLVLLCLAVHYLDYGKLNPSTPFQSRLKKSLPQLLGCLGGLAGAQQMVFSKSLAELIAISANTHHNQFLYWLTYFMIVCALAMAVLQIKTVNTGLANFDVVYFLPIYNTYLILLGISVGFIYFAEFETLTKLQIGMFSLGTLVCVIGVLLLKKPDTKEHAYLPIPTDGTLVEGEDTVEDA